MQYQNKTLRNYRFNNLNSKNKLQLYNVLYRLALKSPPVTMNTISKSSLMSMERIQNKSHMFITNTRWDDFRASQSVHQLLNILRINITIDNQLRTVWQQFRTNI